MADTWAGTANNQCLPKKAIYDGAVNGDLAFKSSPPAWSTNTELVTWDDLDAQVVMDAVHPTGLQCPTKAAVAAEVVVVPSGFTATHDQSVCPTETVDLVWSSPNGNVDLQYRETGTIPWTSLLTNSTANSYRHTATTDNRQYQIRYNGASDWASESLAVLCPL